MTSDHWLQGWADIGEDVAPAYDLAAPDPLTLTPRVIGVQLSRLNRFAGASCVPWSVADHSRLTARIADRVLCRDVSCDRQRAKIVAECLIHDVPEVLTGDIPSPTLHYLDTVLPGVRRAVEDGVHAPMLRAMRIACGLPLTLSVYDAGMIGLADLMALALERQHLLADPPRPWSALPDAPALGQLGLRGGLRPSQSSTTAAEDWCAALEDALALYGARPLWHLPTAVAATRAAQALDQG